MLDYNVKDITVIIHKGRRGRLRALRIEKELGRRVNIHWRIESWRIESDSDRAVQRQSPKKKRKAGEGQAALFGGAM